jgi:voltage-gated potassium channel Kch
LAAAASAVFPLGVAGHHQDAVAANAAPERLSGPYVADLFYRTVQLFVLEFNPRSAPLPVTLEFARWLAVTVAGVALVKAAAQIFRKQLDERRLRRLGGHVIVCGVGEKGFHLVEQLRARGDRVAVIEIDDGDDYLSACRDLGAAVLIGDATHDTMLRRAGVVRASRLIAVCKSDGVNIEIAVRAKELLAGAKERLHGPLACHVHIHDPELAELFRQQGLAAPQAEPIDVRAFSFYENSARDLFLKHPLDAPRGSAAADGRVHLVVVGLGRMGEGVVLQAARIGHFAGNRPLKVTVIDPQVDERKHSLLARYPKIERAVELSFDGRHVEHPGVRASLCQWANESGRLAIAICIDDDSKALSIAFSLPDALARGQVPIFVRQSEQGGLAALVDRPRSASLGWNVIPFGAREVAAGLEQVIQEKLDVLARSIHEQYLAERGAEGAEPAGNSALLPWDVLGPAFKSSNRQQADHIDVKLRAVGCCRLSHGEPSPSGAVPFAGFTAEEIEVLSRMEHSRWCADRYLSGWQPGAEADKSRKTTPYLVPFDDLPEEIKDRDRQAVVQIPNLAVRAGERIVRVASGPSTPEGESERRGAS